MSKLHFRFSIVPVCFSIVAVLAVTYIGLIAAVMSYASLTIEFSQSVKNDQAAVAILEAQYLSNVATIQNSDYHTLGYMNPVATLFVPTESMTALR